MMRSGNQPGKHSWLTHACVSEFYKQKWNYHRCELLYCVRSYQSMITGSYDVDYSTSTGSLWILIKRSAVWECVSRLITCIAFVTFCSSIYWLSFFFGKFQFNLVWNFCLNMYNDIFPWVQVNFDFYFSPFFPVASFFGDNIIWHISLVLWCTENHESF